MLLRVVSCVPNSNESNHTFSQHNLQEKKISSTSTTQTNSTEGINPPLNLFHPGVSPLIFQVLFHAPVQAHRRFQAQTPVILPPSTDSYRAVLVGATSDIVTRQTFLAVLLWMQLSPTLLGTKSAFQVVPRFFKRLQRLGMTSIGGMPISPSLLHLFLTQAEGASFLESRKTR